MARRFQRAFKWGLIVGGSVFGLGFFVPLAIAMVQQLVTGESSGNGPLLGFILGPPAFILGFIGGLLGEDRQEQTK